MIPIATADSPFADEAPEAECSEDRAIDVCVVVPVYNESGTLGKVLEQLLAYIDRGGGCRFEVVVVDDGSTDESREIAESFSPQVKVIVHPYNRGYGSALATGAEAADARYVVFYDSDGQHTIENLKAILAQRDVFDMVVGARQRCKAPIVRSLGRLLIHAIASYLVDFTIPDLNSGLRLIDRKKFLEFRHLYPRGFSLSRTVTLAFIKGGYSVGYVPIQIEERTVGHSTVSIVRDGTQTVGLVVRLIMLFAPQKIFLPIAAVLFSLGAASFIVEVYRSFNIGENTAILLISSIIVFLVGLLADQVAAIRRELRCP